MSRRLRVALCCAPLAMLAVLAVRERADAHALHTTLLQVAYAPGRPAVQLTVRAFADDFLAASTGREAESAATAPAPSEAAAYAYVRRTLQLRDRSGRAVALQWCGLRRTGEVVLLCLRANHADLAGASMENRLLLERFADQVNIVQAERAGRRTTLLFTRQHPVRRLP